MEPIIRRSLIGTLAGAAASAALIATAGTVGLYLLFGAAIGAAFSASTGRISRQHDDGGSPRCATLGNFQRHRFTVAVGTNAGVERRADA